jgi:uncharacterized membrane protein (DUF485 family)
VATQDAKTAKAPRSGVADTQRLRFLLAAILAGVYFTLVLIMALLPAPLAATRTGGIVSAGMFAALVMILLVFAVMGAFVRWIDGRKSDRS